MGWSLKGWEIHYCPLYEELPVTSWNPLLVGLSLGIYKSGGISTIGSSSFSKGGSHQLAFYVQLWLPCWRKEPNIFWEMLFVVIYSFIFDGIEVLFPTYVKTESQLGPSMPHFGLDVAARCVSSRGEREEGSQNNAFLFYQFIQCQPQSLTQNGSKILTAMNICTLSSVWVTYWNSLGAFQLGPLGKAHRVFRDRFCLSWNVETRRWN